MNEPLKHEASTGSAECTFCPIHKSANDCNLDCTYMIEVLKKLNEYESLLVTSETYTPLTYKENLGGTEIVKCRYPHVKGINEALVKMLKAFEEL